MGLVCWKVGPRGAFMMVSLGDGLMRWASGLCVYELGYAFEVRRKG